MTEPSLDPSGPPLGSVFSLQGRPAPGLYAAAWFSAVLGLGLLAVAFAAGLSGNRFGWLLFLTLSFVSFFVAAVLGSGYQALVRRERRDPSRYRGPSPFLVFAAVFAAANSVNLALLLAGLDAALSDRNMVLLSVVLVVPLYAALVWLLVVREGALDWSAMGWPTDAGRRVRAIGEAVYGALFSVPVLIAVAVLGGLLALLFGVTPPSLIPAPSSATEWLLDIAIAVVLAPIGEELLFRGFAQTAWTLDLGPRAGIIRAAVFFALIHGLGVGGSDFSEAFRIAIVAVVARLPVALALGWVFWRTRSIAASIGLHMAYNGLTLVLLALASSVPAPTG